MKAGEPQRLHPLKTQDATSGQPPHCRSRRLLTAWLGTLCALCLFWCQLPQARAATLKGTPSNYTTQLQKLKPGDTLELAAGTYTKDLNVRNLNGTPNAWITIKGPSSGDARFVARSCCNTVELVNASYVAIVGLLLDGKGTQAAFGVSAKGGSGNKVHHIRIEGCTIQDYNGSQQIVGISTKTPTWGWQIRNNEILRPGTGLYLGNSNGAEPFFDSVIEGNLIIHPTGYGMQIKHQNGRPSISGMPTGPTRVIIRHNVFIKDDRPSPSGDRPNLLLGGFPTSGTGSQDIYEVYGNFFYHNPRESLLQATGRMTIHDNVFVDVKGTAILLRNHNGPLRLAHVYNNTIYAAGKGISMGSNATEGHQIVGNLIFAGQALSGSITNKKDNITDTVAKASDYVQSPSITLGQIDLYPKPGKCEGAPLDLSPFAQDTDGKKDFNGTSKGSLRFRGAYAGSGSNPGWKLAAARKVLSSQPPPTEMPTEPAAETTPEPINEPTAEPAAEPMMEPATEPSSDAATPEPSEPAPERQPSPDQPQSDTPPQDNSPTDTTQPDTTTPRDASGGDTSSSTDTSGNNGGCGCQGTGGAGSLWLLLGIWGVFAMRRKGGAHGQV